MAGVDPVTLAIIGGGIGAATNKDDPLRGAMMGATLGYTGGTMFPGAAAGGSGISAATTNAAMTSTGTASAAANAANPYALTQGNLAAGTTFKGAGSQLYPALGEQAAMSEGMKASASQLYSPQAAQAAGMNGMQKMYMANMGLGLLNGGPKNNTVSNQSMGRPGNPQMVNAQPIYNLAAAAPQQQRRRVISLI
jgi:hypothetical protein